MEEILQACERKNTTKNLKKGNAELNA